MLFINGDYFDTKFEQCAFDGVITDIPYKGCLRNKLGEENFSFLRFLSKTDQETRGDGFLITFCNFLCAADLIHYARDTNWQFHTHQIWDKQPIRTWISWGYPLRHTEYILYFKKGNFKFSFKTGEKKEPYKRSSFGGKLKTTIPNYKKEAYCMFSEIVTFKNTGKKIHPTQKPVDFSSYFARIVGGEKRVLDPFVGSGNLIRDFPDAVGVDVKQYIKNGQDLCKNVQYFIPETRSQVLV